MLQISLNACEVEHLRQYVAAYFSCGRFQMYDKLHCRTCPFCDRFSMPALSSVNGQIEVIGKLTGRSREMALRPTVL